MDENGLSRERARFLPRDAVEKALSSLSIRGIFRGVH